MKKIRGALLPGAEVSDSLRKKIRNDGALPGAEASENLRKKFVTTAPYLAPQQANNL